MKFLHHSTLAPKRRAPQLAPVEQSPAERETTVETVYNRVFWLSYIANVALVTANALTFRFAELVAFLGGAELVAGAIISTGMAGALVARFFLGQWIDRYGTRRLWAMSSVLFVLGCFAFLTVTDLTWIIYASRIAFSVGLAGMFTSSIVHIQNQVPAHRRTEVIGSLGSSGFLGMILGTQFGDLIFHWAPPGHLRFATLFGGAAALGLFYLFVVLNVTRNDSHQRPHDTPAAHRLIFKYWPGAVLLVAIMMGVSLAVTTVFLTRFATERSLSGIGTFFTGYSVSAFIFRVKTRHWSRTVGRHRMILAGLAGHCIGHSLLPSVHAEWFLIVPSIACGFGHALLFPAVISLGSGVFPQQYRGTGTAIVLGFTELGVVLSAPLLGSIIDVWGFEVMFYTSAGMAAVIALYYWLRTAGHHDCEITTAARSNVAQPSHPELSAEESPLSASQPESQSPPVPFPHIGRNS